MRRLLGVAALLAPAIALMACGARNAGRGPLDFSALRRPGDLEGAWVGGLRALGGVQLIDARWRRSGGEWTGELRVPTEGVGVLRIEGTQASRESVRFTVRSPLGVHTAVGRFQNGLMIGRISGGGVDGPFHLLPVEAVDDVALAPHTGTYRVAPRHTMLVVRRPAGHLAWTEIEELPDGGYRLAGGALYAYSADTFFSDRSIRVDPSEYEYVRFGAGAEGAAWAEWHPETRPRFVATRVDGGVRQERVRFRNGGLELGGTILFPPGAGPHPAVAMVHGSGPVDRANPVMMLRAEILLRSGFAVLLYDKRGTGESQGDWETAGFEDLAADAVAAVAHLRGRDDIAVDRVGLAGHSQAGWIIPMAASMADGVGFAIISSGGAVPPMDQELFRAEAQARANGLPAEQVALARRLMELKWRFARTGEGWSEYQREAQAAAGTPAFGLVGPVLTDEPRAWAFLRAAAGHDPRPHLDSLRIPTLVVLAGEDANHPTERAAAGWRETLGPRGTLTLERIPGVPHSLIEQREGVGSVFPATYVGAVQRWLRER